MNGLSLAYLGDAYYELEIRRYLLTKGYSNVDILHKMAIKYVSSEAQAKIIDYFIKQSIINEEELIMFKRGRNASSASRKNVSAQVYQAATGFEALIGSLSLTIPKRANQLIKLAIEFIEME